MEVERRQRFGFDSKVLCLGFRTLEFVTFLESSWSRAKYALKLLPEEYLMVELRIDFRLEELDLLNSLVVRKVK